MDIDGKWFGATEHADEYTHGPHDTAEEAALAVVEHCRTCRDGCLHSPLRPGAIVKAGQLDQFKPTLDADWLLGDLKQRAMDECGDTADGWELGTPEQVEELQQRLQAELDAWLVRVGGVPRFGEIGSRGIVKFEVTEAVGVRRRE